MGCTCDYLVKSDWIVNCKIAVSSLQGALCLFLPFQMKKVPVCCQQLKKLIYSICEPLPQVLLDNICTWKFFLYLKEFNYLRADYLATFSGIVHRLIAA